MLSTINFQPSTNRDPLNKERRFIPLRLDDAPIKGSLAQFLYINWLKLKGLKARKKVAQGKRGETSDALTVERPDYPQVECKKVGVEDAAAAANLTQASSTSDYTANSCTEHCELRAAIWTRSLTNATLR